MASNDINIRAPLSVMLHTKLLFNINTIPISLLKYIYRIAVTLSGNSTVLRTTHVAGYNITCVPYLHLPCMSMALEHFCVPFACYL